MKAENSNVKNRFLEIISEETELLKQQIAEEIKNLGDPIDAKMNHNDKLGDSKNQNLVMKNKSTSENKPDKAPKTDGDHPVDGDFPMEVDMNQQPSKQGSDEKASTAVEVKAGSAKGGEGVTAGQAKANFTSKSEGPKKSVSDPFTDGAPGKMNQMDSTKGDKEAPKTYVQPGSAKGGTDVTAGQHSASFKDKAPKSDNDKRIATGIQLKESYTASELKAFILSEATKIAKKQILESKINNVKNDLKNL